MAKRIRKSIIRQGRVRGDNSINGGKIRWVKKGERPIRGGVTELVYPREERVFKREDLSENEIGSCRRKEQRTRKR